MKAHNDNDNNIYVVDKNKKRTGKVIGQTQNPWDFMKVNEKTNKFYGHVEVTFNLENMPNGNELIDKYVTIWKDIVLTMNASITYTGFLPSYFATASLAILSRDNGAFDIKQNFSKKSGGAYTALYYNGKITTARTIGNILFGMNMRLINKLCWDQLLTSPEDYYRQTMPVVGKYNQEQNNGNGFNSGFPFYGEATYSGTGIYYGYFDLNPALSYPIPLNK